MPIVFLRSFREKQAELRGYVAHGAHLLHHQKILESPEKNENPRRDWLKTSRIDPINLRYPQARGGSWNSLFTGKNSKITNHRKIPLPRRSSSRTRNGARMRTQLTKHLRASKQPFYSLQPSEEFFHGSSL